MLRMRMLQDLRDALKPEHMGSWAVRFNHWAQVPRGCGLMRIKAEMEALVSNTPCEFFFMSDDEQDDADWATGATSA